MMVNLLRILTVDVKDFWPWLINFCLEEFVSLLWVLVELKLAYQLLSGIWSRIDPVFLYFRDFKVTSLFFWSRFLQAFPLSSVSFLLMKSLIFRSRILLSWTFWSRLIIALSHFSFLILAFPQFSIPLLSFPLLIPAYIPKFFTTIFRSRFSSSNCYNHIFYFLSIIWILDLIPFFYPAF